MKKKIIFFLIIVIALLVLSSRYDIQTVSGNSMNPTLKDGDIILVDLNKTPEDGDILTIDAYKSSNWDQDSNYIIKRYYADYSTNGYYVMGDNSEVSYDSRYVGEFDKDSLNGVVVFKFQ